MTGETDWRAVVVLQLWCLLEAKLIDWGTLHAEPRYYHEGRSSTDGQMLNFNVV